MEPSQEPIGVRVNRLNAQLLGKPVKNGNSGVITKEGLLDAFQVLYDECNSEQLKKCDKNVQFFVDRYKKTIRELARLRVNATDFEIKGVIGRGHFGDVHLVKEKQTGDFYAMKTVKKFDTSAQKNVSYEEERDIMARSRSVWLTTLKYAFQDDASLFFVMEYHPGGDLLGLLYRQGGSLPESAATFYIGELVLALHDLHEMGYVHRDIKPDNVLIDRCGHVKLADFGSAAKLNDSGVVDDGLPVGTPDYVAPEVLASLDNKNKQRNSYGVSCDYWSLGVLAYELTVGNAPFTGQSTAAVYSKILNHAKSLKFPSDIVLSQAYVSLIKNLVVDEKQRFGYEQIVKHSLFKNVDLNGLRDQVPPYIPKITADDDISNFSDVPPKKNEPNMENYKRKTQFSGRNLPFVGFTYLRDTCDTYTSNYARTVKVKDEYVHDMKQELQCLRRKVMQQENFERKLAENTLKVQSIEHVREKLERDLSKSISECMALKRTLELERKDRSEVEGKALELIKIAKQKWENAEKLRTQSLYLELQQQKDKIIELSTINETLNEQLKNALHLETKQKLTTDNIEKLSRKSVIGLESRLEKITTETQNQVAELKACLFEQKQQNKNLLEQLNTFKSEEATLKQKISDSEVCLKQLHEQVNNYEDELKKAYKTIEVLQDDNSKIPAYKKQIDNLECNGKEVKAQLDLKQAEVETKERECQRLAAQLLKFEQETNAQTSAIDVLQKKLDQLTFELEESRSKEESNKVKVSALEEVLTRLQDGIAKLENSGTCESVLREQVERLEQQLVVVHENAALLKQELTQLKTKHWRMQKELENAEIDKRILQRESREYEKQIKMLTGEIEMLKKQHEHNEQQKRELLGELNDLKGRVKELECENVAYNHLKEQMLQKQTEIDGLLVKIETIKTETNTLQIEYDSLKNENTRLNSVLDDLKEERQQHINTLENREKELQNMRLNLNALRDACVILENQLVEYERLHDSMREQQATTNADTEKWLENLAKAQEDIRQAKKMANEEKSYRLLSETKCKRLLEDVECVQNELEAAKMRYSELKEYSNGLAEELDVLQRRMADLEVTVNMKERMLEELSAENKVLKEEGSKRLTHLENLRANNYEFKHKIDEYADLNRQLMEQIGDLEASLNEKLSFYKERELKSDATIQQQSKLINYLQTKLEEHNNKKKSFAEKLFNHSKKENIPPLADRNLEEQLSRERQKNKALCDEIDRLKAKCEIGVKANEQNVNLEGWIEIPNKLRKMWEKKYAKITDDTIYLYNQPKQSIPIDSFVFKRNNCHNKFIMEPSPSEIVVPLPEDGVSLTIKLEVTPESSCWPPEAFVFKVPDQKQKEIWGKTFHNLFQDSPWMQLQGDLLFKTPAHCGVINCLVALTEINAHLIGTDSGLYSHNNSTITKINNAPTHIDHITFMKNYNVVLMIGEEKRNLLRCDLNHLVNLAECAPCSKPTLKYDRVNLNGFYGFHVLCASKSGQVGVATAKQLILAQYDAAIREFVPLRVLDTAEPTCCVHFSGDSVLVGADKFFEINLDTFAATEFLKTSDLIARCYQMKSFPIGIFEIGGCPGEYLCCYNEFGVFVSEFGRCVGSMEIKWSYLPKTVHYLAPYLYVVHFQGLEMRNLKQTNGDIVRINLSQPRYLGNNKRGVFLLIGGNEVRYFDAQTFDVHADLSANNSDSEEMDDDSDRFSFTSSVVQCLEANGNDNFSETGSESSTQPRKVTFTDL